MTIQFPLCPLCKERCGRFLCPCCGMHAEMPWKCDLCQPHEQPCMVGYSEEQPEDGWVGCPILILTVVLPLAITVASLVLVYRAMS